MIGGEDVRVFQDVHRPRRRVAAQLEQRHVESGAVRRAGFGFGGTMIAGCGSSGAAVATAGAVLEAPPAALSAGFAASEVVACALVCGDAAAEVSAFFMQALRATAPQSAKTVNIFRIMVSVYFTSPAAWTKEEGEGKRRRDCARRQRVVSCLT